MLRKCINKVKVRCYVFLQEKKSETWLLKYYCWEIHILTICYPCNFNVFFTIAPMQLASLNLFKEWQIDADFLARKVLIRVSLSVQIKHYILIACSMHILQRIWLLCEVWKTKAAACWSLELKLQLFIMVMERHFPLNQNR